MTGLFTTHQDLSFRRLASRMVKSAGLDARTFSDLRDDPSATVQSIVLVPIIGLCYGVGLGLPALFVSDFTVVQTILFVLLAVASVCVIAIVWSGLTFLLVEKIFRRPISYVGLSRPFFFAWSPGLVFILMSISDSDISNLIRAAGTAWIVISTIYAVKNTAGLTTQQSILIFIVSALALLLTQALIVSLFQTT